MQNPVYWGNAYLQDEYSKAGNVISSLSSEIVKAIRNVFPNAVLKKRYGSTQEFSQEDLRGYHYMFGMPYFEDNVLIG